MKEGVRNFFNIVAIGLSVSCSMPENQTRGAFPPACETGASPEATRALILRAVRATPDRNNMYWHVPELDSCPASAIRDAIDTLSQTTPRNAAERERMQTMMLLLREAEKRAAQTEIAQSELPRD